MVSIDVEVDIDDILWNMSKWDKQNIVDTLYEDGIVPKGLPEEIDVREPETYLEHELSDLLDKIWNNRKFINYNDLKTLKYLSNKGI
jgi:hypothetical protein